MRAHNLRVAWESYVYEGFSHQAASPARDRRRLLALSLTREWVTKQEATDLSPDLIRTYALSGPRTPARDLNSLVDMGLAQRSGPRYRSSIDQLQAFTSPVAETSEEADLDVLEELPPAVEESFPTLFDEFE